ncbi:Integrase, catalytic core domain-containing protein [Rozella allomycis CSF55]|uniref:Integrase, catalytic core domain-containing protein n=1 Tax=Rozella allomycis (strain CSF55) TaxID=988480 RepID=A0A075AQ97_ROZAC|nr:Integrase, catalytic core domain-containing protein [Rozella allomycis CSF55]|eukprot:EPZ30777.1 Integrase, catalytic core domain-containing protein [Rozella allomycis CSF55]
MGKLNTVNDLPNFGNQAHMEACEGCATGKSTVAPIPKGPRQRASQKLEEIHSDVCGPFPTPTTQGFRYFVTFIDGHTDMCWIYILKKKSEVFEKFKKFKKEVEKESGMKIKKLICDNGGEYLDQRMKTFLEEEGIKCKATAPYSPFQNGIAERRNRTLLEAVRSMLSHSGMEKSFWAEALLTANFTFQRIGKQVLKGLSSIEAWTGQKPSVKNLRSFGCEAYVHIPKEKRRKLDDKARKLIFIGYDNEGDCYRFVDDKKNLIRSRSAKFIENVNLSLENMNIQDSSDDENIDQEKINVSNKEAQKSETSDSATVQRKRSRSESPSDDIRRTRAKPGTPSTHSRTIEKSEKLRQLEPKNYKEDSESEDSEHGDSDSDYMQDINHSGKSGKIFIAKSKTSDPDTLEYWETRLLKDEVEDWDKSIQVEINGLRKNGTYEMVKLPEGKRAVQSKLVFRRKRNQFNQPVKFKCRMVGKGFTQKYGTDYTNTYSPVMGGTTLRLLLIVALKKNLKIAQVDFEAAYLNSKLEEEIYLQQPREINIEPEFPAEEGWVMHLKKGLYGLKQSARAWYLTLKTSLESYGFKRLNSDWSVWTRWENNSLQIVAVYVDDLLIFAKTDAEILQIKRELKKEFIITETSGGIGFFIGIFIENLNGNYYLSQQALVEKMLGNVEDLNLQPTRTPMENNIKLSKDDCPKNDAERKLVAELPYRKLLGSLLYLANNTRPDLSFAVGFLARYASNYGLKHWEYLLRVVENIARG